MALTLDQFNKVFRYQPDKADSWRVLRGPYEGDCDDYAVTALWITEGGWLRFWWALLTFQAIIWLAKDLKGERHVILWGRKRGWICNHYPTWRDTPKPHRLRVPFPFPVAVIKMLLGKLRKPKGKS